MGPGSAEKGLRRLGDLAHLLALRGTERMNERITEIIPLAKVAPRKSISSFLQGSPSHSLLHFPPGSLSTSFSPSFPTHYPLIHYLTHSFSPSLLLSYSHSHFLSASLSPSLNPSLPSSSSLFTHSLAPSESHKSNVTLLVACPLLDVKERR